jgi:hypothetical protein
MAAPKGHKPYNTKGEGGRPTIYTDAVIEKYADDFKEWLKDPTHIWFKDFALDNDFDPDLLGIWAKKNVRFSGVLKMAKHKQESKLFNGGLTNSFNSNIVKFTLNVHHDWVEKKQTIHSNDPDSPVPNWIIATAGETKDLVIDESEG